jgi:radical SAM superfamily enzyme YgiQ (UPF0313 family)
MLVGFMVALRLASACDTPYTVDQLLTDLVSVEDLLRNGDDAGAGAAATAMEAGIACLNEPMP